MVTRETPWAQGTPSWIELVAPDPQRAGAFYADLLGWELDTSAPSGQYVTCRREGLAAAGLTAPDDGDTAPPHWLTYLAVDDVAATLRAVEQHGGSVVSPAEQVRDLGAKAVVTDPTGARFALWQAGERIGTEVANEPGSLTWNECWTRDQPTARDFYEQVLGVGLQDISDGAPEHMLMVDEHPVGGVGQAPATWGEEVPNHWEPYFLVEDADASRERAIGLGAMAAHPAVDTPFGRIVQLAGPSGERFAVISAPPGVDP